MIVWSVVAGVHSYVRRQRISNVIRMYIWRGGLVFRRLISCATMAPTPRLEASKSSHLPPLILQGSVYGRRASVVGLAGMGRVQYGARRLQRRPSTPLVGGELALTTLIRTNSFEVLYCLGEDGKPQVNCNEWNHFGDGIGKLSLKSAERPIYFVATMSALDKDIIPETESDAGFLKLEHSCLPLCWRSGELLEVLFVCNEESFLQCACSWADRQLIYRDTFQVEQIETVDVSLRFQHYVSANHCASIKPSPQELDIAPSPFMQTLEQLCVSDILAVKRLCDGSSSRAGTPNDLTWNIHSRSIKSTDSEVSSIAQTPIRDRSPSGGPPPGVPPLPVTLPSPPLSVITSPPSAAWPSQMTPFTSPESVGWDRVIVSQPSQQQQHVQSKHQQRPQGTVKVNPSAKKSWERRLAAIEMIDEGSTTPPLVASVRIEFPPPPKEAPSEVTKLRESSMNKLEILTDPGLLAKVANGPLVHQRRSPDSAVVSESEESSTPPWLPPAARIFTDKESQTSCGPLEIDVTTPTPSIGPLGSLVQELVFCGPGQTTSASLSNLGSPMSVASAGTVGSLHRTSTISKRPYISGGAGKPPNVLIYTGADDLESRLFEKMKDIMHLCLNVERYTVYRLKHNEFGDGTPQQPAVWTGHARLIVVCDTTVLTDKHWEQLYAYFRQKDGKLLFICQNKLLAALKDCRSAKKRLGILRHAFANEQMSKEFEKFLKELSRTMKHTNVYEKFEVRKSDGKLEYFLSVIRNEHTPLLMYMQNSVKRAGALFSDVGVEQFIEGQDVLIREALNRLQMDVSQPLVDMRFTPGYLLHSKEKDGRVILDAIGAPRKIVGPSLTLEFYSAPYPTANQTSSSYLPVFCSRETECFDRNIYFDQLNTRWLGHTVLFLRVVGSTMKIFERWIYSLPKQSGVVAIARHQTQGQGRSGNQWLSPAGCAMFTFALQISLHSRLGQSLGFLQHLIALSLVDGVRSRPEYKDLNLRLKWPNDIYHGPKTKLGGVLVQSSIQGDVVYAAVGCGINVTNSHPTVCINDVLRPDKPDLVPEAVIAWTLNQMEYLLDLFEESGPEAILPLYYRYWLHSQQEISLAETQDEVEIVGLDEHGYLAVRSKISNTKFSVQPDGNTFDMLHNLIKMK